MADPEEPWDHAPTETIFGSQGSTLARKGTILARKWPFYVETGEIVHFWGSPGSQGPLLEHIRDPPLTHACILTMTVKIKKKLRPEGIGKVLKACDRLERRRYCNVKVYEKQFSRKYRYEKIYKIKEKQIHQNELLHFMVAFVLISHKNEVTRWQWLHHPG